MRVRDTEDSIYQALRGLAWRPYLTAMWILCGELRPLYADEHVDAEGPLMASTLDLVRDTVITGETREQVNQTVELVNRATELEGAWNRLRDAREDEASTGHVYAWATFRALAQEIAGTAGDDRHGDAVEFVTGAVTERRVLESDQDRPIWTNNPDEAAEDSSPMAQTLSLFEQIITVVAGAPQNECDPMELRTQIRRG